MMSLRAKLIGSITIVVVVVVSFYGLASYRLEKGFIDGLIKQDTRLLTETIRNSISNSMRHGRSDEVGSILSHIRSEQSIRSIRIVDEKGKILNSANPSEIGTLHNATAASVFDPSRHFSVRPVGKDGTYVAYAAIHNTPACHGCHPFSRDILGILEVQIANDTLATFHSTLRSNAIALTLGLMLLLLLPLSFILLRSVDSPLRKLSQSIRKLENGDFDCELSLDGSREMAALGEEFNTMIHRLRENFDRSMEQQRQLISEDHQAHHEEIRQMNLRLESQLAEIEQLNADLRRKLEELEEANYTISDLAGELEAKNSILETTISRLSTLYRISVGLSSTMEMESLYDMILKTTMETVHSESGYILFRGPQQDRVTIKHAAGIRSPSPWEGSYPLSEFRISRLVMETGRPVLVGDGDSDVSGIPLPPHNPLGVARSTLLCVPLKAHQETIGTLVLLNKERKRSFDSDDLDLVATIASQASMAIKNAMLYEDLQKAYFNTIQALVSAIEASDSYTRGHSERVTQYALSLARRIDQPVERLKILERAAVLHDIGKIGIDLSLLNKTGRLTPSDVELLRQHPLIGTKILDPISFLNDVKVCISQHHERYDGTGYPNALASDELLLESRILAIADAFDAMTTDRPYRKALSVEAALRELEAHAGTQFDPELVPIFVDMIRSSRIDPSSAHEQTRSVSIDSPPFALL